MRLTLIFIAFALACGCAASSDDRPDPCAGFGEPCVTEAGEAGTCRPVRGPADAGHDVIEDRCVASP